MKRRLIVACAVLGTVAALPTLRAQPPADPAAVHRLSGCYRLTLGTWSGPLPTDLASAQTPPRHFRLDTAALPAPFAYGYAVEPRELMARPRPRFARPAAWRPFGGDSLSVFWSTGFVGVRLHLIARGDTLLGRARTFDDVHAADEPPDPEASVTASRIPCDTELRAPAVRPLRGAERAAADPPAFRYDLVQVQTLSLGGAFVNAWADVDTDGDLDLFVGFNGSANRLYRNDRGVLTDVAASAGVADARPTRAAAWGDYDADGDPDLLVGFAPGAGASVLKLYRNDRGQFTDITAGVGLARDSGAVRQPAWVDVDDDGDLDLFVAFRDRANALFRNDGGTFRDVAPDVGLADTRRSVGAVWFDYDEDGDLDLYVANMDGDANGLYRNDGTRPEGTRFVDVAGEVGLAWSGRLPNAPTNGTVRPCAADVNGDGRLDLFTANYGKNGLFLNRGGTRPEGTGFEDVSTRWGVAVDGRYDSCAFADVDHDGRLDLYVNGTVTGGVSYPDFLFLNRGDRFEDVTTDDMRALHADHGVQWADYDRDGDVDLALTGARPDGMHLLLRNSLPREQSSRSLQIRVLDARGRATRAGAEVRLFASGTRRLLGTRLIDSGSGYDSQSDMPVHFGLATLGPVDVEVVWPAGGDRATTTRRRVDPREWRGRVLVIRTGR